jgi:hypothetical protein
MTAKLTKATQERLIDLLQARYPGEGCPGAVVKTIDNEVDALETIRRLQELFRYEIVWGYALSPDSERWETGGSLVDAVDAALDAAEDEDVDVAYVVAGQYPCASAIAAAAMDTWLLLEYMEDQADAEGISAPESGALFDVRETAGPALEDALRRWAAKHVAPATYWTAVGSPIPVRV